jgi:pimeloyl-ACP methyl ester carboxylesterase
MPMDEVERFVSTRLGTVAVITIGDPTTGVAPLVMWPSLLMDRSLWSQQVSHFVGRVPTICVDPPGHGRSEPLSCDFALEDCAEVLKAILDEVGVQRAHLIGDSWGAMTSATFAALAPQRTASLVLLNVTAGTASFGQRLRFRSLLITARLVGRAPAMLDGLMERIFFAPGIRDRNPDAVEEMLSQVGKCDPKSVRHAIRSVVIDRRAHHNLYAQISAPTLVVSGHYDRVFPPIDGQRMAKAIPGAHFLVVPDAGHLLAAEVPHTINSLLDAHLKRTAGHG